MDGAPKIYKKLCYGRGTREALVCIEKKLAFNE